MWTWITEDARDADRVLRDVLAPMLRRDPDPLGDQLCVRTRGALRGAALALRGGRPRARIPVATRRRAAAGRSQRRPRFELEGVASAAETPAFGRKPSRPFGDISERRPRPALHRLSPGLDEKQPLDRPPNVPKLQPLPDTAVGLPSCPGVAASSPNASSDSSRSTSKRNRAAGRFQTRAPPLAAPVCRSVLLGMSRRRVLSTIWAQPLFLTAHAATHATKISNQAAQP